MVTGEHTLYGVESTCMHNYVIILTSGVFVVNSNVLAEKDWLFAPCTRVHMDFNVSGVIII